MIFTESQIMSIAQSLYEKDRSVPASTDDEYLVRRDILNSGVGFWEGYEKSEWETLFTTLSTDYTGADRTVATSDTQSDCPTSLVRIGKYVRLVSPTGQLVLYKRKNVREANELISQGSTEKFFYITGKPNAYKINWNPIIPSDYNGYTIDYIFYKKASLFASVTDVCDAPDHMFLVHYLLSWLYKSEDAGKAREQLDIADNMVSAMKEKEILSSDETYDSDIGGGFGI